jgi:hypothetical protein
VAVVVHIRREMKETEVIHPDADIHPERIEMKDRTTVTNVVRAVIIQMMIMVIQDKGRAVIMMILIQMKVAAVHKAAEAIATVVARLRAQQIQGEATVLHQEEAAVLHQEEAAVLHQEEAAVLHQEEVAVHLRGETAVHLQEEAAIHLQGETAVHLQGETAVRLQLKRQVIKKSPQINAAAVVKNRN